MRTSKGKGLNALDSDEEGYEGISGNQQEHEATQDGGDVSHVLSSPVNSPQMKHKNGVLELFTPLSPRRRKRSVNNVPNHDGVNSYNGSVLSSNITYHDEVRRNELIGEREYMAMMQEAPHQQMSTLPNIKKTAQADPDDLMSKQTPKSNASVKQKRYGNVLNPHSYQGILSDDSTTMASQLGSQHSKYMNSKYSHYEDRTGISVCLNSPVTSQKIGLQNPMTHFYNFSDISSMGGNEEAFKFSSMRQREYVSSPQNMNPIAFKQTPHQDFATSQLH